MSQLTIASRAVTNWGTRYEVSEAHYQEMWQEAASLSTPVLAALVAGRLPQVTLPVSNPPRDPGGAIAALARQQFIILLAWWANQ